MEEVYRKAAKGEALTRKEQNRFKSAFMVEMGKLYNKYGFVMQLHIGTYQDANHRKVREIGRSTGFDCTDDSTAIQSVGALLNRLILPNWKPLLFWPPVSAMAVLEERYSWERPGGLMTSRMVLNASFMRPETCTRSACQWGCSRIPEVSSVIPGTSFTGEGCAAI